MIALLLIFAGVVCVYHVFKSKQIDQRFVQFLKSRFSEDFGLKISIGKVYANPSGIISISDVRLTVPVNGQITPIFLSKKVSFKYSIADLFRQKFSGWFDIILEEPTFYSNVPFDGRVEKSRSLEIFSGLIHRVKKKARLVIQRGTVVWIGQEGVVSEISGSVEGREFNFHLTLNHIRLQQFDVTTTLHITGIVEDQVNEREPKLLGKLSTNGSVINWKPIPEEATIAFELTKDSLIIQSAKILGGFDLSGVIGHTSHTNVDLVLETFQYPLAQMHDILSFKGGSPLGTFLDAKLQFKGSAQQPTIDGQVTIQNPEGKDKRFKNIQLNFSGVYPEINLSESRMVAANGSVMRFSNRRMPVQELFKVDTYERMIRQTEQTSVAWGDWTLARREDEDSVWVEKNLANDMTLKYQHYEHDETKLHSNSLENENELSFEYFLSKKGSISMDIKDDEQLLSLKSTTSF